MWFQRKKSKIEPPIELLKFGLQKGKICTIENHNSFQTRAESSIKMVMDAIKLGIKSQDTFEFYVHTGDFPEQKQPSNHFYYCTNNFENINTVFPDFLFDHWNQVGIENYTNTCSEIAKAGEVPHIYSQLLWIGNTLTNPIRKEIISLSAKNHSLIKAIDTCADQFFEGNKSTTYISLPQHTHYKYLIDIEGRGFSARLKLLLFTKRVLFIQEREWKTFYHFELQPYKHYIPVKNDLSDFISQIQFVESKGEDYYNEITANAFSFAQKNLTYEFAVSRINQLINTL